jgi:dTMP kinase
VAAQRRAAAREPDRLESEAEAFFERVRSGYAARCAAAPQRMVRIEADAEREKVRAAVLEAVARAGGVKGA